jgi:hypothetical protein
VLSERCVLSPLLPKRTQNTCPHPSQLPIHVPLCRNPSVILPTSSETFAFTSLTSVDDQRFGLLCFTAVLVFEKLICACFYIFHFCVCKITWLVWILLGGRWVGGNMVVLGFQLVCETNASTGNSEVAVHTVNAHRRSRSTHSRWKWVVTPRSL